MFSITHPDTANNRSVFNKLSGPSKPPSLFSITFQLRSYKRRILFCFLLRVGEARGGWDGCIAPWIHRISSLCLLAPKIKRQIVGSSFFPPCHVSVPWPSQSKTPGQILAMPERKLHRSPLSRAEPRWIGADNPWHKRRTASGDGLRTPIQSVRETWVGTAVRLEAP